MGRVIGFIPARSGSKSIPGKNIKEINGKPLIYWATKALVECEAIDEVVISTDGDEISEVVNGFGFSKVRVIGRSERTATDSASTESAIIEFLENESVAPEDCLILVQATSPLLTREDIAKGVDVYNSNGGNCSVVSAVLTKRFFWNENGLPVNYDFNNRPRRQDFAGLFMENGAFYLSKVEKILATRCRISDPIKICEMPEESAIELDEPLDWLMTEQLMKARSAQCSVSGKGANNRVKILLTDVDGVLTDAGMYYSNAGDELKKFNTRDGMGMEIARNLGVVTGIITSEITQLVQRRAEKMNVKHLYQGAKNGGKLSAALKICSEESCELRDVAYVGDDLNCLELLSSVGVAACPSDASQRVKEIPGIVHLKSRGGEGVLREFVEYLVSRGLL